jgi:hypothetical protein
VFFIDPDGMEATPPDEYVFNRNGTFKRKIEKPGTDYIRIDKTECDDSICCQSDLKAIDNGTTNLVTVSDSAINNELKDSGVLMKQTR